MFVHFTVLFTLGGTFGTRDAACHPPIWRAPTDQRIPCCSFTGESPDGLSRYRLLPLGADESGDGIGGFGEFFFGFGATGFGRADHAVAHMVIQ